MDKVVELEFRRVGYDKNLDDKQLYYGITDYTYLDRCFHIYVDRFVYYYKIIFDRNLSDERKEKILNIL